LVKIGPKNAVKSRKKRGKKWWLLGKKKPAEMRVFSVVLVSLTS
tara:strand:+ start:372 stop:503 length:132 start_codon:yes stop_codon:yes gene_type:complete